MAYAITPLCLAVGSYFRIKSFDRMLVLYRPDSDGVEILRVVHAPRSLLEFLRRESL